MKITTEQARDIGKRIGIDWAKSKFPVEQLRMGIDVEHEHGSEFGKDTNVGGDDDQVAARIAWAHLKELPDYYTRLHKMEVEGEKALDKKANGDDDDVEAPGKPINAALVKKWFQAHPNPADEQVHEFSEEHGYNPHDLEAVIYRAATKQYQKTGSQSCETPGAKIKSKGKGRGKAIGKGKGPLGVPVKKKRKKKPQTKTAAYQLGVRLALEEISTYF